MADTTHQRDPSGRFLLRIDPGLHAALRDAAEAAGLSLNEYCARKLALGPGAPDLAEGARRVVARAAGIAGEGLEAVAVYGSWSRGQAGAGSDVDVLVVVGEEVAVTRDLYRAWDREPVRWDGREVDPHFVHLPDDAGTAGGLWGEVALDGLVLFERNLRLSRFLTRIRGEIADGRLVRKRVHGQPYWVRAA